jgi:hypothetical protein
MPAAEIRDRVATTVRREATRLTQRARPARWRHADLAGALVPWTAEIGSAVTHLSAGRIDEAHHALGQHFATRPRRWPVTPAMRDLLARTIRDRFPDAAATAAQRADAIADGRFDLLGYRDLRFRPGGGEPDEIDWHRDPVHGRIAPRLFWSDVPYLDPACGDHKIIWELNRHQHFLTLGRAWWLTGHRPARATFVRHLASWMEANPPLVGVNWASALELALRSLSWIWALECFVEPVPIGRGQAGGAAPVDAQPWTVLLLLGLDRQLQHVEQNLSTWFSPNTHLLGEALALYVAGRTLPELRRGAGWAALGRRILIDEMGRQIGADGGHAERSFHYHRYTLDFYLLALVVARLTRDDDRPFTEAVRRLARFARAVADDRGRLARIGDDDGGQLLPICGRDSADASDSLALAAWLLGDASLAVGPVPEEAVWMSGGGAALARAGTPAATPSIALTDSGYTVCRSPRGDHLVLDTGPHGYLNGGHAHADALSITLTVAGRPLLVDPGTACYTIDAARRDRFRSTRLHNTLTLDDRPQSEPAGPFHWATAATGSRLAWCTTPSFDYVEGAHDGYAPLVHRRAVFARPGCWVVADRVLGAGDHQADLHWHLDPRWTVGPAADGWVRASDGAGDPVWIACLHGELEIIRGGDGEPDLGWIAPAYGALARSTTLRMRHRDAAPFALLTVIVHAAERPAIEALTVRSGGTIEPGTAGLRLRAGEVTDTVVFGSTTPAREARSEETPLRRCGSAGDFETDAAFLWCRARGDEPAMHVVVVDGSVVRTVDGRSIVALAAPVAFQETVA